MIHASRLALGVFFSNILRLSWELNHADDKYWTVWFDANEWKVVYMHVLHGQWRWLSLLLLLHGAASALSIGPTAWSSEAKAIKLEDTHLGYIYSAVLSPVV